MNFYKFLRLNLFYFQLCGFYPYQVVQTINSAVNKSIIWIATLFNLTSVTLQATIVFYNYNIIFKRPILLGKVVDMFKYAYLTITCLTILIESIMTVDDQKSFWAMSWKLEKNFQKILPSKTEFIRNRIYKKNLLKTYGVTVAFICIQIYLYIQRTCIFCSLYTLLAFYAFNRYLHYILYVDIIHQQATNLGCELDRLIEISVSMGSNKLSDGEQHVIERFLVARLKRASSFYVQLYDMAVKVNGAFGWSLLINLVHSYIQIFVDFFWMFQLLTNGLGQYFVECFISMLPFMLIIGLVFYTTTDCHRKVHSLTMKVYTINENGNSTQLSTLIHNFILQTQHLPIVLDAKGFFQMDFAPIKDMIASIATFLVFIIQSSQSAKLSYNNFVAINENGQRIM